MFPSKVLSKLDLITYNLQRDVEPIALVKNGNAHILYTSLNRCTELGLIFHLGHIFHPWITCTMKRLSKSFRKISAVLQQPQAVIHFRGKQHGEDFWMPLTLALLKGQLWKAGDKS